MELARKKCSRDVSGYFMAFLFRVSIFSFKKRTKKICWTLATTSCKQVQNEMHSVFVRKRTCTHSFSTLETLKCFWYERARALAFTWSFILFAFVSFLHSWFSLAFPVRACNSMMYMKFFSFSLLGSRSFSKETFMYCLCATCSAFWLWWSRRFAHISSCVYYLLYKQFHGAANISCEHFIILLSLTPFDSYLYYNFLH